MNQTLCGHLAGQYVTAAYLFIDTRSRVVRYGAAGHPPMLWSARRDEKIDEIEQNGLALGFFEGAGYSEREQTLQRGERFLLYTDGLIEAADGDDDLFGVERLKATLASAPGLEAREVIDHLLTTVDTWSRRPPSDDVTVIVVDCAGAP
jgi:sigma-B regulation protein RsbU (phosphoserine phosphatase)